MDREKESDILHRPQIVKESFILEYSYDDNVLSSSNTGNIKLENKVRGLAPGQFIVIYDINSTKFLRASKISKHY